MNDWNKKKLVRVLGWVFKCFFFFCFFLLKDKIFADERRREAISTWGDKALIGVVPHWRARIRLFFTFCFFCFLSHHAGWRFFFLLFLFSCIFNSLCNFSHYKLVNRRAIFTHFRWQKKKAAKRWPCYSGEWKEVNIWTARFVFIIGCVFCVEALALSKKKVVEGRRDREREKILQKKKKKKRGVKASLNDFFALKEVRRKTDYSLDISRWRYSRH